MNDAGRRQEARGRVFGIEPRFDGVAEHARMRRQALAFGDFDLEPHQVDAGDQLGDRMLHLDARIDFDEIKVARGREQKLHCSGVGVADGAAERDGGVAHALSQIVVERGRGLSSMIF